jgi:hypothetical protein
MGGIFNRFAYNESMPRRPETSIYQLPLELGRPANPTNHDYQIRTGIISAHRPREPLVDRALWEIADRIQLRSPEDAAHHLIERVYTPWEQCRQEELWVLLLNTRNLITHEIMAYRGTVNTIGNVRVAEIFRPAVLMNSPAILIAHNHPSADCEPSPVIWRKSQIQTELLLSASCCLAMQ